MISKRVPTRIRSNRYFIQYLLNSNNKTRKNLIKQCSPAELMALSDLAANIVNCNHKLTKSCKKCLKKQKAKLKKLFSPITTEARRRVLQTGGLLTTVLSPLVIGATSAGLRFLLDEIYNG